MNKEAIREIGQVAKDLGADHYVKAKTVNSWVNTAWSAFGLVMACTTLYLIFSLLHEIPKLFP